MRPWQLLVGKYVAFLIFVASITVVLTVGLVVFFDLPLTASLGDAAAVLALLTVASLGIGFAISSLVSTELQAVNATMFFLLVSVFFSGFVLSVDRLVDVIQPIAWALPITHAIDALRSLVFTDQSPGAATWVTLTTIAILGLAVAMWRLRRELRSLST